MAAKVSIYAVRSWNWNTEPDMEKTMLPVLLTWQPDAEQSSPAQVEEVHTAVVCKLSSPPWRLSNTTGSTDVVSPEKHPGKKNKMNKNKKLW
jgi:hypothetical protein